MQIGPFTIDTPLFVAPMAGVTDRPFRMLCKTLGAGYAVSEMVTSRPELRNTPKTSRRLDHCGESGPIAVQITGTEPREMADAARENIDCGAQIIDINMGCPAKKVCQKWAGSALMQNETLAIRIIEAVVAVCSPRGVPVTLKMRTGWDHEHRNAPALALAAQSAGIAMLTVHGRTRDQGYRGEAEYDTVAHIKSRLDIPVVANGDIYSPAKARQVLEYTRADALMVGRAAQGRPWIFRDLAHYLGTGQLLPAPTTSEVKDWMTQHLHAHYALYGEDTGVRSARKHLVWLLCRVPGGRTLIEQLNQINTAEMQLKTLQEQLDALAEIYPMWPSNDNFHEQMASGSHLNYPKPSAQTAMPSLSPASNRRLAA